MLVLKITINFQAIKIAQKYKNKFLINQLQVKVDIIVNFIKNT